MKFEFSLCEIHLIFMEETFLKTQLKQEFVYNKIKQARVSEKKGGMLPQMFDIPHDVQNNALFAALIIPAMMKEALGFTDKY